MSRREIKKLLTSPAKFDINLGISQIALDKTFRFWYKFGNMNSQIKPNLFIPRSIANLIKKNLFQGKVIVIYGARQTGKTTLVKNLVKTENSVKFLNCDEIDVKNQLSEAETSTALREILGNEKIVVIDEAQRVKNIGLKLKLIVDNFPKIQLIVTGSSSFELANEISEPLTGRNFEFWLYPFSLPEIKKTLDKIEIARRLESLLIYGSYPEVFLEESFDMKLAKIKHIVSNYFYIDAMKFQNMKNSETVLKLLQALALQIGQEVSFNELANLVGVSKQLVSQFIDILEKVFVVFRLPPLSRNLRQEINRSRKIYFYDLGVRNALINNFNRLSLRNDVGGLWENFVISEFRKKQFWPANKNNSFFWRTYDGAEVDLVEEEGGFLRGFEIKWKKDKAKKPKAFLTNYKNSSVELINHMNYLEYLS